MNTVIESVPEVQAKTEGSASASLAERGPLMRLRSRRNRSSAPPSRLALTWFEARNHRSQPAHVACRQQGYGD